MNVLNAIGRVGRDAVVRYTQAGKAVTGFPLAVDIGWGESKTTLWLDCSLWGERGEKLAAHLLKGSQPTVSGELGTREHDGKTYVTLNVREVSPEWQKDAGNGTSRQNAPRATQRPTPATQAPVDDEFGDDIPFVSGMGAW